MGGQSQQQPVFYDADMGQYYTQSTPNESVGRFMQNPNGGINVLGSFFGKGGERNYLNNMMNQSSPALQQAAPYEYADVSLESLFPMLQGALQGSQGGAGLLGSQGATGSASSGAGRFM